jgi:hypothetical protein
MRIGVITNPNARKNQRHSDRLQDLEGMIGEWGLVRETETVEEIADVLSEFAEKGVDYWVSDGGDGSFHWMLNQGRKLVERAEEGLPELPSLVPTNGGTIDFVAKKAGIKGNADQIISRLLSRLEAGDIPGTEEIESLEVVGHRPEDPDDDPSLRQLGFAVAIGGIGQRFFSKYYEEPEQNPWTIIRVSLKTAVGHWAALPGLRRLPLGRRVNELRDYGRFVLGGTKAKVVADGREFPYDTFQGLHAAAVDIDFGTMKLFPYAKDSGRLHFVAGTVSPLEATFRWLYLVVGRPVQGRHWHEFPGEEMEVHAIEGEELLDPVVDGELFYGFRKLLVRPGPRIRVPSLAN